ncbi:MAG: PAS domain S-box protein [Ramlibacter sp.]
MTETTEDLHARIAAQEVELAFLRAALDSAGDGVVALDYNGRNTYFNTSYRRMWDVSAHELVTARDKELLAMHAAMVKDEDGFIARIRELRGSMDAQANDLIEFKDGRVIDRRVAPLRVGGQVVGVLLNFRDVTQHRRQERENLFSRIVMENSGPMFWYEPATGNVLYANKAACEHLGYTAQEIVGQHVTRFSTGFTKEISAEMRRTLHEKGLHFNLEVTHRRKDGSIVDVESSVFLAKDGGRVVYVASVKDITARKRIETEIRKARDLAEEATRTKSDFLANMSHEIRTPMNAVLGLSHLLLKTELSDRQRDYVNKVLSSGQHLLGIIDDILDFSKVEAGKLELECREFALTALLEGTANFVSEKCRAKGLELVFETAPDVPTALVGDALRLGQVLLNYANNAVKFTDSGQIVISVQASERTDTGVLLHFRVRDSGIGLTPEQTGRLFRSFAQADSSTTRKFGGTGLGLAICKQLAQLMDGEVGVESELGKGSTFWFSARLGIPAFAHHPASVHEPVPTDPLASIRGARILLVEDNDINQLVARELMEDAGLVVDVANDGRVGLDMAQTSAYDLVLMDMQMPVMDGLEATRAIRAIERLAGMPVVAMTANAMAQDRRKCLEAGMLDVLVKPMDPPDLWAMLLKWVKPAGAPLPAPALPDPAPTTATSPAVTPTLHMA